MCFPVPKSRSLFLVVASALCSVGLAGCASEKPPTMGDHMLAIGESHQQVSDQWHAADAKKNEAEDDIRAAKKAIKQAEKDLKEAREDLVDANDRLAEARQAMADSESEFHRLFPGKVLTAPE